MIHFHFDVIMKTCFKCLQNKEMSEFYTRPAMRDGHLNKCKACCLEYSKSERLLKPEVLRVREWKRNQKAKRQSDKLAAAKLANASQWKKDYTEQYRTSQPEKHSAHKAVRKAVKSGVLLRTPCEVCGSTRVEGHHDDYRKPLDVRWLCKKHHAQVHHAPPIPMAA